MAGITALGTTYNLPNYGGILFALTPADTPFFSALGGLAGGGQSTDTEFEWSTYDLRAASQPNVLEGADAPTTQERVRAQVKNVTQIHQEQVQVSYTKQAAVGRKAGLANFEPNPVTSELDWQTAQMLKQMVRDIDFSYIQGAYQLPTDNTTARKTRGLLSAIVTNVTDAQPAAAQTGAAAASTDVITLATHGLSINDQIVFSNVGAATPLVVGTSYYVSATGFTTGAFEVSLTPGGTVVNITVDGTVVWDKAVAVSKTLVDATLQAAYDNGGISEQATATLLCNSAQKRAITTAYVTAGNYVQKILTGNIGGVRVDQIDTDFGTLNVMMDRQMPQNQLAIVSMEMCQPVFLEIPGKGHFFSEPLARTGSADKVQIYGETGLAYGNEKAHAKIVNLAV